MAFAHIIALFVLPWLSGGIPRHPDGRELIDLGHKAAAQAQYDKAIALYSAALRKGPGRELETKARSARAYAYADSGNPDAALADCTEVIRLSPDECEPYMQRGQVYNEAARYDEAIKDFNVAIRLETGSHDALLCRGASYHLKGDRARAIEDYTEVISKEPDSTEAYSKRALAYRENGDHDKALADFKKNTAINRKVIEEYQRAVAGKEAGVEMDDRLDAEAREAYNNQAWILATCPEDSIRDGAHAVEYALKACGFTRWRDASCIDTYAAALAEAGDFSGAIKFQTWYTGMMPRDKEGAARLDLYKKKRPYRETKP